MNYGLILCARVFLVIFDLVGIALLGVAVSLITGVETSGDSATGRLINILGSIGVTNTYLGVSILAVAFFFAKGFGSMALNRFGARGIARIEFKQTATIFERILKSDVAKLERWSLAQFSQGLGFSSEMAFGKSLAALSIAFGELILILGIVSFLAIVSFPMFIALTVFCLAVGSVMAFAVGRKNKSLARLLSNNMVGASSVLEDSVRNFRQIRAMRSEKWFLESFNSQRLVVAEAASEMSVLAVLPRYITEISLITAVGALVLARSILGDAGLPVSVATIFVASVFRLVASLLPLQGSVLLLQQVDEAADLSLRMRSEFNAGEIPEEPIGDNGESKVVELPACGVQAKGLSYRYGSKTKWILKNLNFHVEPGQFVAITGISGAGKSTFADLILGLRQPTQGGVLLDGMEPAVFINKSHGGVGYVPQNAALITGTFLENITLQPGSDLFDRERFARAIAIAHLDEVLQELPQGVNTLLGLGYQGLSGGQVQRVALARAIYRQPRLLILDEATSALDSTTELVINAALQELKTTTTIIAIAHRRSTIEAATAVWELKNGSLKVLS
jgi:ATP-binding cassette, subfamily B, bacterial PglK